MILLLAYLLKVSVCVVTLFTVYYLLLRHHTFHQLNRVCLVSILVFSFVVPLAPVTSSDYSIVSIEFTEKDYKTSNDSYFGEQSDDVNSKDRTYVVLLLPAVYFLGALFFFCRFINSFVRLYKLTKDTTVAVLDGTHIRRTRLDTSFTFFNMIFISAAGTDPIILRHEKAHVAQLHWIDLFIAEVISIILWFNPVMILVRRELRLQHEYLADRSVIASGVSFEDYAQCLMKHLNAAPVRLHSISGLHSSSTKQRILMMTRKKTPSVRLFTYGSMAVAGAVVLMSFGKKENTDIPGVAQGVIMSENIPDTAPVDLTKVTKIVLYGDRIHPVLNERRKHTGIDFELRAGSDVVATADGVVVIQRFGESAGNVVRIQHSNTYSSRYYHLQRALVKVGDKVRKGQVIGLVGNTGLSSVPHLHYEVLKNDVAVDPKDYLPALPSSSIPAAAPDQSHR